MLSCKGGGITKKTPLIKHLRKYSDCLENLKSILREKIPEEREKILKFRKQHGKFKVDDVRIHMMYGGMRGLSGLVSETSVVDPNMGIRIRGKTIPDLLQCLPTAPDGSKPLPEGVFWLMLTNQVPTAKQARSISKEWAERSEVPDYVWKALKELPDTMHPLAQLSIIVTALNTESLFVKEYSKGTLSKDRYWDPIYEDAMNLIAKLPVIAAAIYRKLYFCGKGAADFSKCKDWSKNLCFMMGNEEKIFIEFMRLFMTIHCVHDVGNVSQHAAHLVGSTLSDPYLSCAAGFNGLAGPLGGLAMQNGVRFLCEMEKQLCGNFTDDKLKEYCTNILKSGQVIPGYGHSILRLTDSRFICQKEFLKEELSCEPLAQVTFSLQKLVPLILKDLKKVQNPWPNAHANSGVLFHFYEVDRNFMPVLLALSKSLGMMANMIWARALGFALERPKSINTLGLLDLVGNVGEGCRKKFCKPKPKKNKPKPPPPTKK